jgi:hypothetical protein
MKYFFDRRVANYFQIIMQTPPIAIKTPPIKRPWVTGSLNMT